MSEPSETHTTAGTPSTPARRTDLTRARPLSTAELINAGVRTEFLVSLALRRAAGGGVAKSGDAYFEWGYPTPSWLAGVFEQLTRTGLLALAERDTAGLQRVSLTPAGQLRDQQLTALPQRVPDPAPATRGAATLRVAGGRSVPARDDLATEIYQLAALLAEVVELAGKSVIFPNHWSQIAELALEHDSVRWALLAEEDRGL